MEDTAQIQARIDEINAILTSGASSINIDGVSISYSFESLRRELRELEKKLPGKIRRPIAFRNRLA